MTHSHATHGPVDHHLPVRYRVIATCATSDIAHRFKAWMSEEHASQMVALGGAQECRVYLVSELKIGCEYIFPNLICLNRYLETKASNLRAKGRVLFSEQEIAYDRDVSTLLFETKA